MSKFEQVYKKLYLESVKKSKYLISDIDLETLRNGAKFELEHTNILKEAEKIAADHIFEFGYFNESEKITSDYYKELKLMEDKLKKELESKKKI